MNKFLLLHKRFFLDYRITFIKIRDVNIYALKKIKFYIKYVEFNITTNKNRIETKLFKN